MDGQFEYWVTLIIGVLTIVSMIGSFILFLGRGVKNLITSHLDEHHKDMKSMFKSSGELFDKKIEAHAAESRGSMAVLTTEISAINNKCSDMVNYINDVNTATSKNSENIAKVSTRLARVEGSNEARFEQRF